MYSYLLTLNELPTPLYSLTGSIDSLHSLFKLMHEIAKPRFKEIFSVHTEMSVTHYEQWFINSNRNVVHSTAEWVPVSIFYCPGFDVDKD